jgi:hypothetical protein
MDGALTALRRCALAASVLHDVDLLPADDGVRLPGDPPLLVDWAECRLALGGSAPDRPAAAGRLADWLTRRRLLADWSPTELAGRIRPVGLPTGHAGHGGADWARARVLGGCLDLGAGFVGLSRARPDELVLIGSAMARSAGVPLAAWWPTALGYLDRMSSLAVARWLRDPRAPLRPMGDCDVVTLLTARTFRSAIVSPVGGMRAAAVPMRRRGWLEVSRIDPAFVGAAWTVTDAVDRGFERPVLVTADEVVLPRPGGRPAEIALRDPAAESARDLLYR